MAKTLYCIRNAHNYSSMITLRGLQQINHIKTNWKDLKDVELVITDRDSKSYSTANGIFKGKPLISIDFLYSPKYLMYEYLDRDKNYPSKDKILYNNDYPKRVGMFYDFLRNRKEVSIAYVGHNKFISTLANNQNKVVRCYPYLFELVMKDYCDN